MNKFICSGLILIFLLCYWELGAKSGNLPTQNNDLTNSNSSNTSDEKESNEDKITRIVKVPVLNMRECPNTNCKILRKLGKNEEVTVLEDLESWSKIKIGDTVGYVVSRSIGEDTWASISYYFWLIVKIIIGLILLPILILILEQIHTRILKPVYNKMKTDYKNRCPKCKKWNAVGKTEERIIGHNMQKRFRTRYKNKIETVELKRSKKRKVEEIPYNVCQIVSITKYECVRKCKYCGQVLMKWVEEEEKIEHEAMVSDQESAE